jgi:hypothetical protein
MNFFRRHLHRYILWEYTDEDDDWSPSHRCDDDKPTLARKNAARDGPGNVGEMLP